MEHVFCTGHGDVEDSHLLFGLLSPYGSGYEPLYESLAVPSLLRIFESQPYAYILVKGRASSCLRVVEPFAAACQNYHRKLQTLALMDCHYPDHVVLFADEPYLSGSDFALLHRIDISHKVVESSLTVRGEVLRLVDESPEVGLSLASSRHCPHDDVISRLYHQLPDEPAQRHDPRFPLPAFYG